MKRVFAALMLSAPVAALAAETVAAVGDAEAGAGKAAVCAACHGPGGVSAVPEWPKLAGQHAQYTFAQLHAFKTGQRDNPVMQAQVANLDEEDFADLSAYFAEQAMDPGVASEDAVPVADALWRVGDVERALPACSACHGPGGSGNPMAAYPLVAGQHAQYTAAQLRNYRSGARGETARAQIMVDVAGKLSDEEIDALASYMNGLQ